MKQMVMTGTNMKRLVYLSFFLLMFIGFAMASGCLQDEADPSQADSTTQIIENITPSQAFALIEANQKSADFVVLDVRTTEEFSEGHIGNATNLDYYSDAFRKDLGALDKDKAYLIYCRSSNRTRNSLDIMKELQFKEVYNMLGGIIRWEEDGLPVVN